MSEPEDCIRDFCCEIVFPSSVRGYTHKVSPTCVPKPELNVDDTNEPVKEGGEMSTRPQPYRETASNKGELIIGAIVSAGEEQTDQFTNTKRSSLKTYIQVTRDLKATNNKTELIVFMNIVNTQTHTHTQTQHGHICM